jgi:uroporphyrinogen decarboxylase
MRFLARAQFTWRLAGVLLRVSFEKQLLPPNRRPVDANMTTSKALVKQAIEFRNPERVPYNFDSNRTPVIAEKYGDDFEWVFSQQDPDFSPRVNRDERYENEFGVVYERLGRAFGEAKEYPLADPASAGTYRLPDFTKPVRFRKMKRIIREQPDKYILGMFPHFLFQQMIDLFGFENFMVALMTARSIIERLADRMMESCLRSVDAFADRGADGMIAIEDLGLQSQLMISPTLWREIYKPRMAEIVQKCHARQMHFLCHTCGGILEVIEDYVELGVDVLQIDQQDNMGIDELARRYAGRICFFCPVDIQTTLPMGTFAQIETKAKHLMKAFGGRGGGFMAKTYPQPEAIDIPEGNTRFMCEVFKRLGGYPLSF